MRPFFFLTLLTSVAFIEVFTFIQASSYINVLIIFALTVFTALIGLSLAKRQIVSAFSNLKQVSNTKETFLNHMVDGVGALVAGFLLLLPGFCTDLIGVLLLAPASRKLLLSFGFQYFLERVYTFHSQNKQNFDDPNDTIIEGEFKSRSYSEDIDKTKPLT
tara:strand:+ start:1539 stop:2021 length:483 start_codon:yes stop_codon:yes gene_type:complete